MQTQTFNIALPMTLVKQADKIAKEEFRNRSELIREALWIYLQNKADWEKLFTIGKKAAKRAGIKSEADVNRIVQEYRHSKK